MLEVIAFLLFMYIVANFVVVLLVIIHHDDWLYEIKKTGARVWHVLIAILFLPGLVVALFLMFGGLLLYLIFMPIGWVLSLRIGKRR